MNAVLLTLLSILVAFLVAIPFLPAMSDAFWTSFWTAAPVMVATITGVIISFRNGRMLNVVHANTNGTAQAAIAAAREEGRLQGIAEERAANTDTIPGT